MPHKRNLWDRYPKRRDADGKWLCRLCAKVCPVRRTSYCSTACWREVETRCNAGSLRRAVVARDHGICATCGLDCRRTTADAKRRLPWHSGRGYIDDGWEADHVVPVHRGGDLSLANVQTLCLECHKRKSAREAGVRAESGTPPPTGDRQLSLTG